MMNDTLRESTVSNEVARSIVDEYATTEQGRLRDELDACIELNRELQMEWAAWQARAEAAENDLRELRENTLLTLGLNLVDVADGMEDQSISYLLNGWKERITELEAQLAAHAWRPVTEKPSQAGYYQTVNDGIYEHCYYGPNGWEDYYLTPTHWRPLTDPPLTGES